MESEKVKYRCWTDSEILLYDVFPVSNRVLILRDPKSPGGFTEEWVECDEVDEWTGLKDKNKKEIFENDIVNGLLFFNNKTLPTRGIVKKYEEYAAFCLENKGGKTLFYNHDLSSFEVIGNIYKNGDLLK
jgi:uncharacterized phage protein (TIGR01671 family)